MFYTVATTLVLCVHVYHTSKNMMIHMLVTAPVFKFLSCCVGLIALLLTLNTKSIPQH